jgi:hypothetical protein
VKTAEPALFSDGELPPSPDRLAEQAKDAYNAIAKRLNVKGLVWHAVVNFTPKRQKKLKEALPVYGGLRAWEECLERASKNRFLLGKEGRNASHKNWKPDLEFFCQEKTIIRLTEGAYEADDYDEKAKMVLPTILAKRAEEKPFVPEAREVRLAASIISYRKIGNHARANAIEEELARIEGRPPVLVPAPDARDPDVPPVQKPVKREHKRGPIFEASAADRERAKRAAMVVEPPPPNPDDYAPGEDYGDGA